MFVYHPLTEHDSLLLVVHASAPATAGAVVSQAAIEQQQALLGTVNTVLPARMLQGWAGGFLSGLTCIAVDPYDTPLQLPEEAPCRFWLGLGTHLHASWHIWHAHATGHQSCFPFKYAAILTCCAAVLCCCVVVLYSAVPCCAACATTAVLPAAAVRLGRMVWCSGQTCSSRQHIA